jgi:hypothetical protein
MAVAAAVPGFGGYFLDASGAPAVYLLDPAQRPAAEAALAAFLASRGFSAADLVVLQGQYEYAQLDAWYRLSRNSAFGVAGIVLGDVDEGRNRIRFGVADVGAIGAVQNAVLAAGVPAGAVLVERRSPVARVATLRNRVRPLQGGLQINFFATPVGVPSVSFLCTYGFNATFDGVPSFVTNSHCSNNEGGEDVRTLYYQHLRNVANFIGTETEDPDWQFDLSADTSLRCPPPFQCRWSDALRATIAPDVAFTLGRIARVDEITTTLDDTIHTIAGYFTIKSDQGDPVQGEIANKVGRTTGWTRGVTLATCVDVLALETNHIRLCQAQVHALVDGGDSGSPVFAQRNNGSQARLLGILWGGSVDESDPHFTYSPLSGIRRDFAANSIRVY